MNGTFLLNGLFYRKQPGLAPALALGSPRRRPAENYQSIGQHPFAGISIQSMKIEATGGIPSINSQTEVFLCQKRLGLYSSRSFLYYLGARIWMLLSQSQETTVVGGR